MPITTDVTRRIFHVRMMCLQKSKCTEPSFQTGTAFALDHGGKQYLVTARHLLEDAVPNTLQIHGFGHWSQNQYEEVGRGEGWKDVAVLSVDRPLTARNYKLEPSTGMGYELAYILGFPYDFIHRYMIPQTHYLRPICRSGIITSWSLGKSPFVIDVIGNPGFSGAPVVYQPYGKPTEGFKIAGVVIGDPTLPVGALPPVVNKDGVPIEVDGEPAYFPENTGLTLAVGIRHVLDIIEANPIGYDLQDIPEDGFVFPP